MALQQLANARTHFSEFPSLEFGDSSIDAARRFSDWFDWASRYAESAGLDPSACPYRLDFARRTLFWKHRPVFQASDSHALLPVAEAHIFGEWADQSRGDHVVFHAATLERNGRALLLLGPSGAGKSTLAFSLVRRGFRYLGDEFSLIDRRTLEAIPFPKALNIKASGMALAETAGRDFDLLPYPPGFLPNYDGALCGLPRRGIVPPAGERFPVGAVLVLDGAANDAPPVRIKSWQAARILHESSWDAGERGFRIAASLARQARCWAMARHDPAVTAERVRALIKSV